MAYRSWYKARWINFRACGEDEAMIFFLLIRRILIQDSYLGKKLIDFLFPEFTKILKGLPVFTDVQ